MTQNEIEMAIESLFDGAARVRAKKQETKLKQKNVHRQFSARVISQMWREERQTNIKSA